ncbi:hypothetical protein HN371_07465 [Candidatus Poribacteria bacterium]|nr:hypothetical protein [Candidatus Poribacteria bacterium]MBT5714418.1 hypothetical protein [Candidatus Poribacteria bacterium]MBT7805797.1 hypothetical protein [Candidatus Poribacteria bacterium]
MEDGPARMTIVALSDGKPGHFHQTRGILDRLPEFDHHIVDIEFRGKRSDNALRAKVAVGRSLTSEAAARAWLDTALTPNSARALAAVPVPHMLLSTGSSVAAPNLLMARAHGAKSVVCTRPSPIGGRRFDLALLPHHQWGQGEENATRLLGVPTHITPQAVARKRDELALANSGEPLPALGLLFGGDDRRYSWTLEAARKVVESLIAVASRAGLQVAVATSRRTPSNVTEYIRARVTQSPVCAYAAFPDDEPPKHDAVITVLAHSVWTAVTVDSFSMVCEAASAGTPVGLIEIPSRRPDRYAAAFDAIAERTRLTRMRPDTLYEVATSLTQSPPEVEALDDAGTAADAIRRLMSATAG